MPKLRLKRTPEEEAAHRLRKKQKKEGRKKRRHADVNPSSSKYQHMDEESSRKWASSDEDHSLDPGPSNSSKHNLDYDAVQTEVEERRFREKMFEAMEDDDRLDSVETQFNDYAHVPGRWRRGESTRMGMYTYEDCTCLDPRYMDDEEYVEWIRMGMYRLKHAKEYAEQERQKATRAVRAAQGKAKKEEIERLEQAAKEEHERRRRERERQHWELARQQYEQRWKALLSIDSHGGLRFGDIPWPILNAYKPETRAPPAFEDVEDLTEDAISKFLLPARASTLGSTLGLSQASDVKEKKDKLRETMLRFHPDKFEGRIMKLVAAEEQARVREGIAQVVRVVNGLLCRIVPGGTGAQ